MKKEKLFNFYSPNSSFHRAISGQTYQRIIPLITGENTLRVSYVWEHLEGESSALSMLGDLSELQSEKHTQLIIDNARDISFEANLLSNKATTKLRPFIDYKAISSILDLEIQLWVARGFSQKPWKFKNELTSEIYAQFERMTLANYIGKKSDLLTDNF